MIGFLLALQTATNGALPVIESPPVSVPSTAEGPKNAGGQLVACFWQANPKVERLEGFAIFLPDKNGYGPFDPANLHDPAHMLAGTVFQQVTKSLTSIRFIGPKSLTLSPKGGDLFKAILTDSSGDQEGTCEVGKAADRVAGFSFFDSLRASFQESEERGR